MKGRGRMTYKPKSGSYRSRSRSRSFTPPHWRNNKTITLSEYEKRKKDNERREIESNRRAELRRQRHEDQALEEKNRKAREEFNRKKGDDRKRDIDYRSDTSDNIRNGNKEETGYKEGYEAQSIMDPDFDLNSKLNIEKSKLNDCKRSDLEEGEHSDSKRTRPRRRFTENREKSPNDRSNNRSRRRSNSSSRSSDSSRSRASSSPSPVRRTNYKRDRSLSISE